MDKTELNRTELKAEDKAKKYMKNINNFFDNKLDKKKVSEVHVNTLLKF